MITTTSSLLMVALLTIGPQAWSKPTVLPGAQGNDAGGRSEALPRQLEGVGVEEHLGQQMPLNMGFEDSSGKKLRLADLIDGSRPSILTFNYSSCPMLCSLQLDGLVDGLKQVTGWTAGAEFNIITVSIDPDESLERTALFKQKYLDQYQRPEAAGGWSFLRGRTQDVEELARLAGFQYRYVPEQKEYAHAAVTMVLTPDGEISRYLYGVLFEPRDLRLSLAEAAQGKQVSTLERILLFCFHYDAASGRYAPMASNIMRLGGALTVLALGGLLSFFWRRDRRHSPTQLLGGNTPS